MWKNNTIYSGDLSVYTYPQDKEFCGLLLFLKQISSTKKIHLTDVTNWNNQITSLNYDVYIICAFGEAVNEKFINDLDNNPKFANKHIILLTSQLYKNSNYTNVKTFYVEHLHTILAYFNKQPYKKLNDRKITHGSMSGRNAVHKSIITAKLLNKFGNDYQYSFCNGATSEYKDFLQIKEIATGLEINLLDSDYFVLESLHNNPVIIDGHQWAIDNPIYTDSKIIWTLESIFKSSDYSPSAYLTEKIIKSIISGSCFVLVSQRYSLERLRLLGFETFENEFGLTKDSYYDRGRYFELFNLIDNFDFASMINSKHVQDIVDYNYNYFYNDFYNHVEKTNADKIEEVIEYINAI